MPGLVWDAHSCLPLLPGHGMAELARHRAAGINHVSINVGMDFNPVEQVMRVIAGFRAWLAQHADEYLLADSVAAVRRAQAEGKLSVAFDLEGSDMLLGDLAMLRLYRDLGVRQMRLLGQARKMPSMAGYGLEILGFEPAPQTRCTATPNA